MTDGPLTWEESLRRLPTPVLLFRKDFILHDLDLDVASLHEIAQAEDQVQAIEHELDIRDTLDKLNNWKNP